MKNIISRVLFKKNYDDLNLATEIYLDLQIRRILYILLSTAAVVALVYLFKAAILRV